MNRPMYIHTLYFIHTYHTLFFTSSISRLGNTEAICTNRAGGRQNPPPPPPLQLISRILFIVGGLDNKVYVLPIGVSSNKYF
jgi:hypothetical protein